MSWKNYSDSIKAAAKKASDQKAMIERTAELMNKYKAAVIKQAAEAPVVLPSTSALRSLRRKMMASKQAADGLTPMERVKRLLDSKIAADPRLTILGIIGQRDARKAAAECQEKPARVRTIETPVKKAPTPDKPLEGEVIQGKTVTFSDGRTVNFPAKNTTPVKSASELLADLKAKLHR